MIEAYKDFWKKYIDFQSKSNRLEFWTPVLIHIVSIFIVAIIGVIVFISGAFIVATVLSVLAGFFVLVVIIPMFAVTLRRFYDAGRRRTSAIILIAVSIIVNISFVMIQINSIAIILNVIAWICTIILIIETLLPSRSEADANLKCL